MSDGSCLFFVLIIAFFLVLSIALNFSLYFENYFLEQNLDKIIHILSEYQKVE